MRGRRLFIAAAVVACLFGAGYRLASAQQGGGAFIPGFAYEITSLTGWVFDVLPTVLNNGTVLTTTSTASLSNKTLTSPVLSGTVTGTYTIGGSPTLASFLNSGTVTTPTNTGTLPTVYSCGSSVGASSCFSSSVGTTPHIVTGQSTLSAGAAAVDTISPAFTGTTTFACSASYASGSSGTANVLVTNTSASKITIAGSGSATVSWLCAGY